METEGDGGLETWRLVINRRLGEGAAQGIEAGLEAVRVGGMGVEWGVVGREVDWQGHLFIVNRKVSEGEVQEEEAVTGRSLEERRRAAC